MTIFTAPAAPPPTAVVGIEERADADTESLGFGAEVGLLWPCRGKQ